MVPPRAGRDEAVVSGRDPFRLDEAFAALAGEPRMDGALARLLEHTRHLTGSRSAAVSVVAPSRDRYTKVAERGVTCRVGSSFPLDEGATGRAVALGRPVVLDDYARLPSGHLDRHGRAAHRSAAAIPVWWRGEVVAVEVVFRPLHAGFSAAELDGLESLAHAVAPAIGRSDRGDPSLGRLLRSRIAEAGRVVGTRVTETGTVRSVGAEAAEAAAELLLALDRVGAGGPPLRVAVVHGPDRARLLVQQERQDAAGLASALPALPHPPAVAVRVEAVPGWGTVLQVDLPYDRLADAVAPTPREREVLALVRVGRTDRQIGAELGLSPRTVEKHVAALLRKTGACSRAAAVATALERGWVDPA